MSNNISNENKKILAFKNIGVYPIEGNGSALDKADEIKKQLFFKPN